MDNEIENISKLATIHDIGKISTPYEVLNKKGKLTKEEMDIVKKHPEDVAYLQIRNARELQDADEPDVFTAGNLR